MCILKCFGDHSKQCRDDWRSGKLIDVFHKGNKAKSERNLRESDGIGNRHEVEWEIPLRYLLDQGYGLRLFWKTCCHEGPLNDLQNVHQIPCQAELDVKA